MCSSASIAKGTSKETFPYISGLNTSLTSNVLTTTTRTHTHECFAYLCINVWTCCLNIQLNRPHPPSSWHKQPAKAYQVTSNFELVATQRHTWKHTSPCVSALSTVPTLGSWTAELFATLYACWPCLIIWILHQLWPKCLGDWQNFSCRTPSHKVWTSTLGVCWRWQWENFFSSPLNKSASKTNG